MSKYGVFSRPYFAVFWLNTRKCEPEKTPYLVSFYAVSHRDRFRLRRNRSSPPEVFLGKGVPRIRSKFMHLCFVTLLKSNFGIGFSNKFAVYFQNTFSLEQFWSAVSGRKYWEIMRSTVTRKWFLVKFFILKHVGRSTLVWQRPMKSLLLMNSLSFLKIRSLVFSDILHDDSWPWYLVTARFLKKKKKNGSPNLDRMGKYWAQN